MGGNQHQVSTVKVCLDFNVFGISFHEVLDEWISNRSYMMRLSVLCIHIWVVIIPDEEESPVICHARCAGFQRVF